MVHGEIKQMMNEMNY